MSPRIFLQGKIKSFQKVHFKSIKYFGLTIKCTNKKVQQDLVCLTTGDSTLHLSKEHFTVELVSS